MLIFLGGKLVGANFYAFCNYAPYVLYIEKEFLYVPVKKKMIDTIEKQNLFWDTLITY